MAKAKPMRVPKLSTGWIVAIGIIAILLITTLWAAGTYNNLVTKDEETNRAWANVQSAYQRRADLIPNLVATVKAYSTYEGDVLTQITEARSGLMNAKTPGQLDAADANLNSAISRLLVVVENYPTLKANENYLSLQDELAGTENRVKTERDIYNSAVKDYNINVRRFPSNILAGWFGFGQKESFAAAPGSENAPKVTF